MGTGLPLLLGRRGPISIVRLVSGNTGDRAAEKVHLEVSLTGPFRFIALDDFQNVSIRRGLQLPISI